MMETKIHLKGLSAKVTSEDLQNYFLRFGEVRQAYIVLDAEQKTTKCFGFVQFYDPEITKFVLEKNHFLYEKRIKCEKFVPKEKKFLKNDNFDSRNDNFDSRNDNFDSRNDNFDPRNDNFDPRNDNFDSLEAETGFLGQQIRSNEVRGKFDLGGSQNETVADRLLRLGGGDLGELSQRQNVGGDEERRTVDLDF